MRADAVQKEMATLLARVAIVLVEPKYPENIGAAARVAMNMGIGQLIVVSDEFPDQERMLKMATHHAAQMIENLAHFQDLAVALEPFSFAIGTTARQGRHRRAVLDPRRMVQDVAPLLAENRIALVFGTEHRGLTNRDLDLCNLFTTIPTMDFSSLNLAQAVAILTYELASGLRVYLEGPDARKWAPKQATSLEMEGMYGHVEEMLRTIGFLHDGDRDEGYWMRKVRQFMGRLGLRSKEVKNIRGFCRQFLWYAGQQRKKAADMNEGENGQDLLEKGGSADSDCRQADQHRQ